jgi:cytochrome c-type biogenesis protein CcmH/NrfG
VSALRLSAFSRKRLKIRWQELRTALADGVPKEGMTTMASETEPVASKGWKTTQVYAMATVCLVIGLALGYLFRGSVSQGAQVPPSAQMPSSSLPPSPSTAGALAGGHPQMPSLDDMKRMADKKVEPLLAKLKSDPRNSDLLNQVGMVYKATHQFKEAAEYFQKAIDGDPKNTAARTDLASCLYYQGDADGAIKQLEQSLSYDPKDANSLFNLGMIRMQAKKDPSGAVTAWQQLLKLNPTLTDEKKTAVEKLIAQTQSKPPE